MVYLRLTLLLLALGIASTVIADDAFEPQQDHLPVAPPANAKILFGGAGTNEFLSMSGTEINWPIEAGALVSSPRQPRDNRNHLVSRVHFRDADIHAEFQLPEKGNGNSGLYLHGNYELQIINSMGKAEPTQEDVGAIYGFHPPLVNAGRPPGEWQVYDIRYRAPRRDESGKITTEGSITAWLNGKKVQDNARFGEPRSTFHPFRFGTTPYLQKIGQQQKKTSVGPLFLQDHGQPVRFRNVWIVPLDDQIARWEG